MRASARSLSLRASYFPSRASIRSASVSVLTSKHISGERTTCARLSLLFSLRSLSLSLPGQVIYMYSRGSCTKTAEGWMKIKCYQRLHLWARSSFVTSNYGILKLMKKGDGLCLYNLQRNQDVSSVYSIWIWSQKFSKVADLKLIKSQIYIDKVVINTKVQSCFLLCFC